MHTRPVAPRSVTPRPQVGCTSTRQQEADPPVPAFGALGEKARILRRRRGPDGYNVVCMLLAVSRKRVSMRAILYPTCPSISPSSSPPVAVHKS